MPMGTKDYIAIAARINAMRGGKLTTREIGLLDSLADRLANYMQSTNSQFSRQRFLDAAGYVGEDR